ncbi:ABC transporter ATP-binding protein [Natronorubrum sulfidifaciens]|uniref:Molybdate/tungstate import ATP-binding protein WtpC n=1 Tax=Natronorubrum sulfidifaciens JCM 14089 TaxID=1230460 RepID=L9WFG4_9EURY|nr:ABC transporter ATP-binding protein [Natronorubrum sulfidifaciens]ELY48102.1 ABC transporter [Natronorubrum sulfidifaciens JCM 14089]
MMLELDSLTHRYGSELAVDDVSFGVEEGELVALLGPSGCGKTTIVQAIAGHIHPTSGQVALRGADVTDTPPESRHISVVFQQSTLYPHMTVSDNVAYGLTARNIDSERRTELVSEYLELVDLSDQRAAYPAELSGGQQRRVELARALAPQPDVLLLDEPLSALDRTLRERLRDEIARIQRETGVTTLFVTHDQDEAMALADRLVVMNEGTVSGSGEPRSLYESPPTAFVASFLGRSNTVSGPITDQQPLTVSLGEQQLVLTDTQTELPTGTTVTCHVRPTALSIRPPDSADTPLSLAGTVTRVTDLGKRYDVTISVDAANDLVVEQPASPPTVGDAVAVALPAQQLSIFGPDGCTRLDEALAPEAST